MPFQQREQIALFNEAIKGQPFCIHDASTFQTTDLYECMNMHQVIICLEAVGRKVGFLLCPFHCYAHYCHLSKAPVLMKLSGGWQHVFTIWYKEDMAHLDTWSQCPHIGYLRELRGIRVASLAHDVYSLLQTRLLPIMCITCIPPAVYLDVWLYCH